MDLNGACFIGLMGISPKTNLDKLWVVFGARKTSNGDTTKKKVRICCLGLELEV
jgi:hypothetical protein